MSDNYGAQRWVSFLNDSGETIPSYALLNFVSDAGAASSVNNFSKRLKAKQFTTDDDKKVYAFNSRAPVAAGKYGKCTFAVDGPAWARIKQTDVPGTDLSADDEWIEREYGPLNGKWSIGPEGRGYRLLTRPRQLSGTDYFRVLVMAERGKYPLLFVNGTGNKVGGPFDSTNSVIQKEVLCWIVPPEGTSSVLDEADRITVNFEQLNALVFPCVLASSGTFGTVEPLFSCWAVPWKDGKWSAISGGVNWFEGEVTSSSSGIYTVTAPFGNGSTADSAEVLTAADIECTAFCGWTIEDGTGVGVQVYNKSLRIVNACCPGESFA